MVRLFLINLITTLTLLSCSSTETISYQELPKRVDSLEIHEGILSQKAQKIKYKKNGKTVAVITLSEPVMVAQADQEEKWGFFQFPSIGKAADGTLVVVWHMREDSHKAYGKSERKYTPMMSKDSGKSWQQQDRGYFAPTDGYNGIVDEGKLLQINTPSSKNIRSYEHFPKPVATIGARAYYKVDQLPGDLQGVYLSYHESGKKPESLHAKLNDSGLLRNSIGDLMPVVWWGKIKQLADRSLVAGIYPAVYQDSLGNILPSSVSFYKSRDKGNTWNNIGRIPFLNDDIAEIRGDRAYEEPAFEILADSSFVCIMRSGAVSPMYRSFSYNLGETWTIPRPFTPNGVNPQLKLLKNGTLVLVSGRPGIQIRLSLDGSGREWTVPFDMIPYMNSDGTFTRDVSCGYASIIEDDENSFFIVYSDFTTKNKSGETRKSIWCRKVSVVQ